MSKDFLNIGPFHVISPNGPRTLVSDFLYFHTNCSSSTQKKESEV